MWGISREKIEGVVRAIMLFIGGVLVFNGVVEESVLQAAVGAVSTLAGTIWSIVSKKVAVEVTE